MPGLEVIIDYSKIISCLGEQLTFIYDELVSSGNEEIAKLIQNIKSIEVSDEQSFRKKQSDRATRRGTVYIVVRFSQGPINFASSVAPVSISALGIANQVKPVQMLLGTFASYWTTKNLCQDLTAPQGDGDGMVDITVNDMLQVWNTPEVVSNFNVLDEDYRNLYRVTGNIIIGPQAVRVGTLTYYYKKHVSSQENSSMTVATTSGDFTDRTLYKEVPIEGVPEESWPTVTVTDWDTSDTYAIFESFEVTFDSTRGVFILQGVASLESEELHGDISFDFSYTAYGFIEIPEIINVMSFHDNYHAALDSQPFGDTHGFAESEVEFSTYTFSISTYALDTQLNADLWAIKGFRQRGSNNGKTSKFGPNDKMKIKIELTNGFTNMPANDEVSSSSDEILADDFFSMFKVVDSQTNQEIAGIPMLTVTFTR